MQYVQLLIVLFLTYLVSMPLFRTFFLGGAWNRIGLMDLVLRVVAFIFVAALVAGLVSYLTNLVFKAIS